MTPPTLTVEEQIEELRQLLETSTGSHREVVRPIVPVGVSRDPETGRTFSVGGPGPVTVVTFYISHLTEERLS